MKKDNRGSSPLAGLTVAAILLASTAGYVSALSKIFQSPLTFEESASDFRVDEAANTRAAVERATVAFQQSLGHTAPAWLTNALPAYSSGRARIAWYSLLDSAGDRRVSDLSSGSYNTSSSGSSVLLDSRQYSSLAPVTGFVAGTSSGSVNGPLAPLASGSWNIDAAGVWSLATNWAGNVIADGAGSTGNFTFNITASRTITIDTTPRTLGIMNIGDSTGGPSNYTIAASGGGTLTFDNSGSNAQLNQTSTSGNNTISAPILLNDSLDITNAAAASTLTLSGGISSSAAGIKTITSSTGTVIVSGAITNGTGTVAVFQNGPGNLSLTNGANTYSGSTTITGGRITLDSDSEPGTGTLFLSGGTLATSANRASSEVITNNISLTADSSIITTSNATTVDVNFGGTLSGTNGTLTLDNTGGDAATDVFSVRFSGGDFTMNRPIALTGAIGIVQLNDFNTTGTTHTYGGAITGTGNYNRSASTAGTGGTTVFTANNTYTGTTLVNRGTLEIANNNSASSGRISGTSSVTVNATGTLTLSGSSSWTDRINDAAPMTLNANSSPTVAFNTGGLSEHGVNNNSAGIGALTLQTSSIIDLSNGASILAFANSSAQTWTGTLSIYNWSGTLITGNGTDQLYFGNDATGLTVAQLGQISFYSDSGTTLLGTGAWGTDLDGEVVPLVAIPEPSTWIGAALALSAVAFAQRRKLRALGLRRA